MKILVFTEGTILMHLLAQNASREERVRQSMAEGVQREARNMAYNANIVLSEVLKGSVYDLKNYVPIGRAVAKLTSWQEQGAEIIYLTSRRIKTEIDMIRNVLKRYHFPNYSKLYFRHPGQNYKDVAEKLMPDILIEDDCESIGGAKEMTYIHIRPELKPQIKSIVVKEFSGIDHLPDQLRFLT